MDKLIFQNQDDLQRIRSLEALATDIVDGYYYQKVLSDEDVQEQEQYFAELHIELARIESEKAAEMAEFNRRIKEKKVLAEKALRLINDRREEVTETVYVIISEDGSSQGTYNQRGELVAEKPLKNRKTMPQYCQTNFLIPSSFPLP